MNSQDIPTFQSLREFDRLVEGLNLRLHDDFPLKRQVEVIRGYYQDRESLGPEATATKWQPRFLEFAQARLVLERFVESAGRLKGTRGLSKTLRDVFAGPITQDFSPSQSKDKFYEIEFAAALKAAGFSVDLREPDIVVSGCGLGAPIGIACKYPSSRQKIHDHISKGYRQIAGQNLLGAVAVGIDLIVAREMGLHGLLNFNKANDPPEMILKRRLETEFRSLEFERMRDYPSERQLDGLILSVSYAGVVGSPESISHLQSFMIGCRPGTPIASELNVIRERIEAIC